MNYTLKQLAEELNVSRQTVYKRASGKLKSVLEPYVFSKYNILYYTEEGANIIRNDFIEFPSVSHTELLPTPRVNNSVSNTEQIQMSSANNSVSNTEELRTSSVPDTNSPINQSVSDTELIRTMYEKETELLKQIEELRGLLSEQTANLHKTELDLVKAQSDNEHSKDIIDQLNQRISDKDTQIDEQRLEISKINNERQVLTATIIRDAAVMEKLMSLPLAKRIFKWKEVQKSLQEKRYETEIHNTE